MSVGKVDIGTGGGSGSALSVIGVAGATITISKDNRSYTKVANSNGNAVFKGLATGTWTITMAADSQIATKTVEIVTDYTIAMAYFSATISITYPANSTCQIQGGTGVITVESNTNTDTDPKTWTVTVRSSGTYTITATETGGNKTKSTTVTITTDGQTESVTLGYILEIYNAGVFGINDLGVEFTVGTRTDHNSITQNSNNLKWWCDANTNNLFYVSPKISTNGFSTLKMRISASNMNGAGEFGLAKGNTNSSSDYVVKTSFNAFTGGKTLSVDVSGITSGTYYVKLTQSGEADADTTATITHIWLE